MKIVIDIPDICYDWIKHGFPDDADKEFVISAIRSGTPLPKGYGELIDRDKLLDELDTVVRSVDDTNRYLLFWDRAVAFVHLAPTVIKADKGE